MATILIIDDSQAHRKQFRDALDGTDLFDRILEAHDGIQGLKALLAERIDVVLCDVEMPGLDGEKLLRVKHASPGGTNIPFLFVTASQDLQGGGLFVGSQLGGPAPGPLGRAGIMEEVRDSGGRRVDLRDAVGRRPRGPQATGNEIHAQKSRRLQVLPCYAAKTAAISAHRPNSNMGRGGTVDGAVATSPVV